MKEFQILFCSKPRCYLPVYRGQLWRPTEGISHLSPFYYYRYFRQVMGEPFAMLDISVLLGAALSGILAAYVVYARRDLRSKWPYCGRLLEPSTERASASFSSCRAFSNFGSQSSTVFR